MEVPNTRPLDSAVHLGILYGHMGDQFLDPSTAEAQSSIAVLVDSFANYTTFSINAADSAAGIPGLLVGRYLYDSYNGGVSLRFFASSLLRFFASSLLRFFASSLLRFFASCVFASSFRFPCWFLLLSGWLWTVRWPSCVRARRPQPRLTCACCTACDGGSRVQNSSQPGGGNPWILTTAGATPSSLRSHAPHRDCTGLTASIPHRDCAGLAEFFYSAASLHTSQGSVSFSSLNRRFFELAVDMSSFGRHEEGYDLGHTDASLKAAIVNGTTLRAVDDAALFKSFMHALTLTGEPACSLATRPLVSMLPAVVGSFRLMLTPTMRL